MSKAANVLIIPSPLGGAWACHINTLGAELLEYFFGDEPSPIAPLGDRKGHIVEPSQCADLASFLRGEGATWIVDNQP